MKPSSSLSRREKLLLGLLTSTLIFSASFSYGAVNSNKVDAIMKMINDGAMKFSDIPTAGQTKSERTSYYEKVDAGLGDAVEMLAVVRNNLRSLMGLSPAYSADDVVGSILGGILGGVGGNTGGNTSGETNTSIMSLCSSDTTVETLTWPSDVTTTMEVTDAKSKVFKVVVPNGGTNMNISYPSISTNGYSRTIPKLYYTVSQKKACAYGDTSLGWSNTLQGGGTLNFSVVSTVTTAPYTSTPKLSPGVWYISFKSQQPLTSAEDPKSKFNIFMVGGITGGDNPASNSVWSSATSISCPTSTGALQSANPSTVSSSNSTGFHYTSVGGVYFNVKNYANASDTSLPTSCTAGQKWIAKSGTNSCSVYSCGGGGAGTSGNPGNTSVAKKYLPVSGSEFALSQGKISQSDIPGAFVNEGGILYFPWEKKAMAAYPECTNQKALDACTVTNSACWKKSSYEKGGGTFHQRDWLACKDDVDLGIFANDPIPPPCPADTKLMNEILLSNDTSGGWIRRPWYVNTDTSTRGVHHVYRLLLMDPDATKKDSSTQITSGDYGLGAILGIKISAYPCDFADLSTIQNGGQDGACGAVAALGPNLEYTYEGSPISSRNGASCVLKKGVTYYVNISSTGTIDEMNRTAYGKYFPGSYDLIQYNNMDKAGGPHYAFWGIYDTYQKYEVQQFTDKGVEGNISSQNPETLRQKVVNDYKTTGKNSEKLTIPLLINTIKDINRTISNAKCEMIIDTTVHASITKSYGKYSDATSPSDTYYLGGMTIKKASELPACESSISMGGYTTGMLTPGELRNIGLCRLPDGKVTQPSPAPECKTLCNSIGGNDGNGWCEPTPGGLFQ